MPYPGGRKQLTAIFLSIKRKKGEAAAKDWYHKAQREGYAPVAKDDKKKRSYRKSQRARA
jgi:hypothetical protein